jgi:hypothetical protein
MYMYVMFKHWIIGEVFGVPQYLHGSRRACVLKNYGRHTSLDLRGFVFHTARLSIYSLLVVKWHSACYVASLSIATMPILSLGVATPSAAPLARKLLDKMHRCSHRHG